MSSLLNIVVVRLQMTKSFVESVNNFHIASHSTQNSDVCQHVLGTLLTSTKNLIHLQICHVISHLTTTKGRNIKCTNYAVGLQLFPVE